MYTGYNFDGVNFLTLSTPLHLQWFHYSIITDNDLISPDDVTLWGIVTSAAPCSLNLVLSLLEQGSRKETPDADRRHFTKRCSSTNDKNDLLPLVNSFLSFLGLEKRFAQIYRALYEDTMLVSLYLY